MEVLLIQSTVSQIKLKIGDCRKHLYPAKILIISEKLVEGSICCYFYSGLEQLVTCKDIFFFQK